MDVVAGRWDDMAAATVRLAELVEELADDSPEEAP
jgi:hypothetical protein